MKKNKNWCQIGVKTEKITISKEIRYCKPLILKGLQKKSQKISTHWLRLLKYKAPRHQTQLRELLQQALVSSRL